MGTQSFVMLLTGQGWGKSTAALGYAVRASAQGMSVTMVQFLKGGAWNGAEAALTALDGIRWPVFTPGLTWGGEDPQKLASWAWQEAGRAMASEEGDLVILDEITRAVDHGLIDAAEVARAVRARHPKTSVIMTGKIGLQELEEVADTVTVFTRSKHDPKIGKPLAP